MYWINRSSSYASISFFLSHCNVIRFLYLLWHLMRSQMRRLFPFFLLAEPFLDVIFNQWSLQKRNIAKQYCFSCHISLAWLWCHNRTLFSSKGFVILFSPLSLSLPSSHLLSVLTSQASPSHPPSHLHDQSRRKLDWQTPWPEHWEGQPWRKE